MIVCTFYLVAVSCHAHYTYMYTLQNGRYFRQLLHISNVAPQLVHAQANSANNENDMGIDDARVKMVRQR